MSQPGKVTIDRQGDCWVVEFHALASPCQVFIADKSRQKATLAAQIAVEEVARIEKKFSRYRDDNVVHAINNAQGVPVDVDDETALLIDYAAQCYALSAGLFDITSGVLRKIWRFDGSDKVPSQEQIDALMDKVGWHRVVWSRPTIRLLPEMQIDFGGIGKEYAVDRTALLLAQAGVNRVLVNYGGDLSALAPRSANKAWVIGIDPIGKLKLDQLQRLHLTQGALATSGDTYRFLLKDGKRYSHILNPLTGWPVADGPRTVTVHAPSCLEAGMLSTFSMLQGERAEDFLRHQEVSFWCQY